MTALGKLLRTTAFKLSIAYLAIFAVGAGFVIFRLGANVKALLDDQIKETIRADVRGLADQYASGGLRQLAATIEERAREPGSSILLLTTSAGESLTGNVFALPPGLADADDLAETRYQLAANPAQKHLAMAKVFTLTGGLRLLVGRDLEERERLRGVVVSALVTSLVALAVIGLVGGLFVSSRVLKRIDGMTASAQTIMAGDLARRLAIAGTGDELDRLATNLNNMLDRIADLMNGLKEVTDNIAHDLKTPLTRLRNTAEQALRDQDDPAAHRKALERTIAESDSLLGVFNAILMIARAEAGAGREGMTDFDAGDIARDMADLYEPLADAKGVRLVADIEPSLIVHGNRELIGQAIVNLVDNALKYGTSEGAMQAATEVAGTELAMVDRLPACEAASGTAWGEVDVTAKRVGGKIELSVGDRGTGIRPVDRTRAVERFVRLEDARSKPGSGLGLSLVAAVARLHGGDFRLSDNKPGLCATITLPPRDAAPSPRRLLPPPAPTS